MLTLDGSYVTVAFSVARFTSAFSMPSSPERLSEMVWAQVAQVIPVSPKEAVLFPFSGTDDLSSWLSSLIVNRI